MQAEAAVAVRVREALGCDRRGGGAGTAGAGRRRDPRRPARHRRRGGGAGTAGAGPAIRQAAAGLPDCRACRAPGHGRGSPAGRRYSRRPISASMPRAAGRPTAANSPNTSVRRSRSASQAGDGGGAARRARPAGGRPRTPRTLRRAVSRDCLQRRKGHAGRNRPACACQPLLTAARGSQPSSCPLLNYLHVDRVAYVQDGKGAIPLRVEVPALPAVVAAHP